MWCGAYPAKFSDGGLICSGTNRWARIYCCLYRGHARQLLCFFNNIITSRIKCITYIPVSVYLYSCISFTVLTVIG